jgi:hypothetical protein
MSIDVICYAKNNCRAHLKEAAHKINGSLKYCSINAHYGRTLSRRDDIESLGYTLILLLNGSLPWSAYAKKDRPCNAIKLVLDMKLAFNPSKDVICDEVLRDFLHMAQNLAFEEMPDYYGWRAKFLEVFSRQEVPHGKASIDWDGSSCFVESTCELSSSSKSSKVSVKV